MKIELRPPRLSDAKRYVEILSHPEFTFFPAKPASIKDEKDFLRKSNKARQEGKLFDFAVIVQGAHIGGAGVRIIEENPHICNLGYFIDHTYWNKGIATYAVNFLESFIAKSLPDIVRIEIVTAKGNIASQKVAAKCGYKKEGVMRKYLKIGDLYHDCYRYAKVLK